MPLAVTAVVAMMAMITTALEPFTNFAEGPCINPKQINFDRTFMDTLRYVSGGSRFNYYATASAMPNYATMREDEFYYDGCYSKNTTTTIVRNSSVAAIFGFGRPLFAFRPVRRPNIYIEAVPLDPSLAGTTVVDTVTLTDQGLDAGHPGCISGYGSRKDC